MLLKRLSLLTILSLGLIILGIGCISYSIYSIWTQTGSPIEAKYNNYYDTTGKKEIKTTPKSKAEVKTPVKKKEYKAVYSSKPQKGDKIGTLIIPALNIEMPVIEGTTSDELSRGVGHFIKSALPGKENNCVISGHRETYFRYLGLLKKGDRLIIRTSAGVFIYSMTGARIVDDEDRTVIVPKDNGVLTLTTCYPFNTPGYYPKRYIVSANLIKKLSVKS